MERGLERALADAIAVVGRLRKVSDALYTHQYEGSVKLKTITKELIDSVKALRASGGETDVSVLREVVEFVEGSGSLVEYVARKEEEIKSAKSAAKGKAQGMKDFSAKLRDAMSSESQFQK